MEEISLGAVGSGAIVHAILDNVMATDGIRLADTSGILVMRYGGFVSQSAGAKDTWGQPPQPANSGVDR